MQTLTKTSLLFVLLNFIDCASFAQTSSTFEFPTISGGYYDGSDLSAGFSSGNCYFPNRYDTSFGGYWASGFAWSTQTDTTTGGFQNLFSCRAGSGFQSPGYGIAQNRAVFRLTGNAAGKSLSEVKVCNSTYAYFSMLNGDAFAKKFGGASGNDPDFFKLTFLGYENGAMKTDSIEFYLADYRFSNNAQDYLIKSWQTVNLAGLGNCDSVMIRLISSDNGPFGMNTPAFVCMDNLITTDVFQMVSDLNSTDRIQLKNPGNTLQHLHFGAEQSRRAFLSIVNATGALVYSGWIQEGEPLDLSILPAGVYPASLFLENQRISSTLIKCN